MSSIVKTEAVVLKSMKYRETSKIVTLYSRRFGKIKVIAKGARQPKSKFGSSLEPMSYVFAVLYKKDSRDLHLLSQCDDTKSFRAIRDSLEKMSVGFRIIELVDKVSHGEEANEPLFWLLAGALSALDAGRSNVENVLVAFQIRLAFLLGFALQFERCVACGRSLRAEETDAARVVFHMERGGPLCSDCTHPRGPVFQLSVRAFNTLRRISAVKELAEAMAIAAAGEVRREMDDVLLSYLRCHVDTLRTLTADKVFSHVFASQ